MHRQEQPIFWFLLIQYGKNVSLMDDRSRLAFIQMCTKLLGQGFSFDQPTNRPTGRRISVSSRMMSEMLGILIYFKALSNDEGVNQCMRLLKHRAEYELYADVILMTESLGSLHEFESQRTDQQDNMGISLELPPTIDMVQQKRTATTTRSIRNRQQSTKQIDPDENASADISIDVSETQETTPTQRHRTVLNRVNGNSTATVVESKSSTRTKTDIETSPMIDQTRTYIASTIGPARASPSPIVTQRHKPTHVRSLPATSPILPVPSARSPDESDDIIPTVIFNENKIRDDHHDAEQTYF